jgi:hypothetical protein
MSNFFHNLPAFVLSPKRHFFRQKIFRKYFENHNIGPWFETSVIEMDTTKFLNNKTGIVVLARETRVGEF